MLPDFFQVSSPNGTLKLAQRLLVENYSKICRKFAKLVHTRPLGGQSRPGISTVFGFPSMAIDKSTCDSA